MWAKFTKAIGLNAGGSGAVTGSGSGQGRWRAGVSGSPEPHSGHPHSLLGRHERSLDEMKEFARDMHRFEKQAREYKTETERFLAGVGSFLRDSSLPRLYDTLLTSPAPLAAPGGGLTGPHATSPTTAPEAAEPSAATAATPGSGAPGEGAAAAATAAGAGVDDELVVVEPPPPAAHPDLYGGDRHAQLLAQLGPAVASRFASLTLPLSVWLGTYEDAKLRLEAARKLEVKAFGRGGGGGAGGGGGGGGGGLMQSLQHKAAREHPTHKHRAAEHKAEDKAAAAMAGVGEKKDEAKEAEAGKEAGAQRAVEAEAASEDKPTGVAAGEPHQHQRVHNAAAAAEFVEAEAVLSEEVAWLVRGAAHLRAWVAGALEAATGGITKEGAAAGPEGVLEPVPPRVVAFPMRRAKHTSKDAHTGKDTHSKRAAGATAPTAATGTGTGATAGTDAGAAAAGAPSAASEADAAGAPATHEEARTSRGKDVANRGASAATPAAAAGPAGAGVTDAPGQAAAGGSAGGAALAARDEIEAAEPGSRSDVVTGA